MSRGKAGFPEKIVNRLPNYVFIQHLEMSNYLARLRLKQFTLGTIEEDHHKNSTITLIMSKYKHSLAQRYAVYTTHGEKCYLCKKPIDLKSMEVDHILPEELLNDKPRLERILELFGLPVDFGINTFNNWLPSCGPCNIRKSSIVFHPSPIIQVEIQRAINKASHASELAQKTVRKSEITKALNTLERAIDDGTLSATVLKDLEPLITYHVEERNPELQNEPIKLSPIFEVISERDGVRTIKGPYGIGGGPIGPDIHSSFRCSNCGSVAWNGARCVVCGMADDD